jgi:hypothetical protein
MRLTKQQWLEEVSAALSSEGARWTVYSVHAETTSPLCYAEVADPDHRVTYRIVLAADRFPTANARLQEIRRQLRERTRAR